MREAPWPCDALVPDTAFVQVNGACHPILDGFAQVRRRV